MERSGDRIVAVITAQEERIEVGRTVLLLANTVVPELLQAQFGVTLPVWTVWPQIVLTEPLEPVPIHYLIGHASRLLAMKSTPDGRVMISGGWRGRLNPATGQGEPQPDQVQGNVAEAVAVYPSLEGVAVSEAKTDRQESTTIDGIPIIDRVPGLSNAVFATGWSGHGWAIAPAVNQLLAAWVYSDSDSSQLYPFRYSRFTAS
jgi:sarcosine oxidase subunit beta